MLARLSEARPREQGEPYALAFSRDGGLLAVATGKRVATTGGASVGTFLTGVAFSPEGKLLVTSDDTGVITEWQLTA